MADYDAGHAILRIVPSFQGVQQAITTEAQRWGDTAGASFGRSFAERLRASLGNTPLGPNAQQTTQQADAAGRTFADTFKARVTAALRSLPDVTIGASTSEAEQKLRDLHAQLEELSNARVGVDIDAATALAKIDDLQAQLRALGAESPNIDVQVNTSRAAAALASLRADIDAVTRDREVVVTGRFNSTLRAQIDAALHDLPDVTINADSSEADRKIDELRTRLETLRARVDVNLDSAEALTAINAIMADLRALGAETARPDVKVNSLAAIADLAAIKAEADRLGKSDPTIKPKVDSSGAMSGFNGLLAAGVSLAPALIPVAAEIVAAIGAIGPAAVAAAAGIGVLAIGGQPILAAVTAGIAVNNAQQAQQTPAAQQASIRASTAATQQLAQAQASLATTEQSVAYAAGQAAQAVDNARRAQQRSAADSAQAVADAQRALGQAQATSRNQAVAASQAVSDAQRALQQTQQSVGYQAGQSALGVRDARANIGVAQQQAQQNNAAAILSEQQAEQSLAAAQQHATDAQITLNEARIQAARDIVNVTNALADARLTQQSDVLNVADAKRQLDLALANPHGSDEATQRARIAYETAQQQLTDQQTKTQQLAQDKAKADAQGVDGSDKVRLAQEQLNASLQAVSNAEAAAALAIANIQKTRIAGDRQIALAQEVYAKALAAQQQQEITGAEQIRAAREALANAQRAQQQQQIAGVQAIQAAEETLANARRAQSRQAADQAQTVANAIAAQNQQQITGAQQIVSAQHAVATAQLAVTTAANHAATATLAAQTAFQSAMAQLGPAGQKFATYLIGLDNQFQDLQKRAGDALVGPLLKALPALAPIGPAIAAFVIHTSGAVGDVGANIERALGSKAWVSRLHAIDGFTGGFIAKMATIGGNFFTGLTDIMLAFAPLTNLLLGSNGKGPKDVGTGLIGLSKRFADFAAGLDKNKGFQSFLRYVEDNAPTVVGILKDVFDIAGKLLVALAPLGTLMLEGLKVFLDDLSQQSPNTLLGIAFAVGAVVTVIAAAAGAVPIAIGGALVATLALAALISSNFDAIKRTVEKVPREIAHAFDGIGSALLGGLKSGLFTGSPLKSFFEGIGHDIVRWFKDVLGIHSPSTVFATIGSDLITGFLNGVKGDLKSVETFFTKTLPDTATGLPDLFIKAFGQSHIGTTVQTWFTDAYNAVVATIVTAEHFLTNLPTTLTSFFGRSPIMSTIEQWFIDARDATVAQVQAAEHFLTNLPGQLQSYFGRSNIASTMSGWFNDARHAISGVLSSIGGDLLQWVTVSVPAKLLGLESAFKTPLEFVVNTLFNNGLRVAFNDIASLVGIGSIGKIQVPSGFAGGGIYPGYTPGRDIGYIGVSGGEAIMRPEWTQAVGPAYVEAANTAAVNGGIGGVQQFLGNFDLGGIIGSIWNGIKKGASGLGGLLGSLTDPTALLKKLLGPITGEINHLASNPLGKLLAGAGGKLLSGAEATLLNALLGSLGGGGTGSPVNGWMWPVNPHPITQGYGGANSHPALDIGVPTGTPVHAAHAGVVTREGPAATSGGAGNWLQVGVSSGIRYAMEHLTDYIVPVGAQVTEGQLIAHTGSTGNSTGPHLHFEIDTTSALNNDGSMANSINPLNFLEGQGKGYGGGGGGNGAASPGTSAGAAQSYAAGQLSHYGWGQDQMPPLIALWNQESGWNYLATNPSSGAYGIPQSLPASKMASAGPDWLTNPATQVNWGLDYIRSSYGNPATAEGHELSHHWYDTGGILSPGYTLAYNGTGKNEVVLTNDMAEFIAKVIAPVTGPTRVTPPVPIGGRFGPGPVVVYPSPVVPTPGRGGIDHIPGHLKGPTPKTPVVQNFYTQGYDEESLARYSARRMGEVLT